MGVVKNNKETITNNKIKELSELQFKLRKEKESCKDPKIAKDKQTQRNKVKKEIKKLLKIDKENRGCGFISGMGLVLSCLNMFLKYFVISSTFFVGLWIIPSESSTTILLFSSF